MWRFLLVLLWLWFVTTAWALPGTTPVFTATPRTTNVLASGTGQTTLYTAGTNGSKIIGLSIANLNANPVTATCQIVSNGGSALTVVVVSVPGSAGIAIGLPALNAMSSVNWPGLPVDSDGNPFFFLSGNPGDKFTCAASVSAQLQYLTIGSDF